MKNISQKTIRSLQMSAPPPCEQQSIADIIDSADVGIQAERAYRDKLRRLKQGLMDDLLTGRVRTSSVAAGEYGGGQR